MARTSSLRLLSSPPSAPHPLPVCAARLGPADSALSRRFHVTSKLGGYSSTLRISTPREREKVVVLVQNLLESLLSVIKLLRSKQY